MWMMALILLFTASCSVISKQIREESIPPIPFRTLVSNADRYIGKTVILGGFILETKNLAEETIITVLQVPLKLRDEPKSKDFSEGRFVISFKGFLDPEVYKKDRKITVAGKVVGLKDLKIYECPRLCLFIEGLEIYLWPKYEYRYYYPYYYDWYYPFYPWYPYDYRWYPYFYPP
jgi:outer membrane lipoprotein